MGFRNTLDRMIEAREKQARRYVAGAMLNLDDATLEKAGYTRAQLKAQGTYVYPF